MRDRLEHRLPLLLLFVLSALVLQAQEKVSKETADVENETKKTIYKKQYLGGGYLHSNGWGFNFAYGKNKTALLKKMFTVGFVNMKHPKEFKSFNPYYEDAKGYFFGKLNAFYILRPTYGQKEILFEKIRNSGVQISYEWGVGPALGFTKPIYLQIGFSGPGSNGYDRIVEKRYDPDKHRVDDIFGSAPWTRGLGELGFHPGLTGKLGVNFEYASDAQTITALETGIKFDAFRKKVPIMAIDKEGNEVSNDRLFLNLYLAFKFGKKVYR